MPRRPPRRLILALVLALAAPGARTAVAQEAPDAQATPATQDGPSGQDAQDAADPSASIDWTARILETERSARLRPVATVRVRVAHPTELGVALGGIAAKIPPSWPCTTACDHRGATWSLELGTGGAAVAAGWATVIGRRGRRSPFLTHVFTAWGVRGAVVRTWNGGRFDPAPGRTLVGGEIAFSIAGASASLGVYRQVEGPPGDRWHVGGGLGWGF